MSPAQLKGIKQYFAAEVRTHEQAVSGASPIVHDFCYHALPNTLPTDNSPHSPSPFGHLDPCIFQMLPSMLPRRRAAGHGWRAASSANSSLMANLRLISLPSQSMTLRLSHSPACQSFLTSWSWDLDSRRARRPLIMNIGASMEAVPGTLALEHQKQSSS